jgi:hypothetical protein
VVGAEGEAVKVFLLKIEDFQMNATEHRSGQQADVETYEIEAEDAADAITIARIRFRMPDSDREGRPVFIENPSANGSRLHWRKLIDVIPSGASENSNRLVPKVKP